MRLKQSQRRVSALRDTSHTMKSSFRHPNVGQSTQNYPGDNNGLKTRSSIMEMLRAPSRSPGPPGQRAVEDRSQHPPARTSFPKECRMEWQEDSTVIPPRCAFELSSTTVGTDNVHCLGAAHGQVWRFSSDIEQNFGQLLGGPVW